MKKINVFLIGFVLYTSCTEKSSQEKKVTFFQELHADLRNKINLIRETLKKQYEPIQLVIDKLEKIELIHNAAYTAQELIKKTQDKLKKEGESKKSLRLNNARKHTKIALEEIDKTNKEIADLVNRLNKKLDELIGTSKSKDNVFKKPYLKQAKNNVSLATQEYNEIFFENINKDVK